MIKIRGKIFELGAVGEQEIKSLRAENKVLKDSRNGLLKIVTKYGRTLNGPYWELIVDRNEFDEILREKESK